MEAVAAGDEIARHLVLCFRMRETNERPRRIERVDADLVGVEVQRTPCLDTRLDQVANHLVLSVNGDGFARRQLRHVDAVPSSVEADVDAFVAESAVFQPVCDTHRAEQINRALFEHASADTIYHVLAAAVFDDHGIDACEMQKVAEQQPGGTGANDTYLRVTRHCTQQDSAYAVGV